MLTDIRALADHFLIALPNINIRANTDMFAWSPSDIPGIPREVAEHSLEIRASSKPVKQRLRRIDEEKRKIIGEEIHKLLMAGFIKEVHHPD